METIRRKQGWRVLRQSSPGTVRGRGESRVEIKQELIRETIDRRRLPEREPQSHSVLDTDAVRRHGFIQDQVHKAAASCVRPDIGMQQSAERLRALKSDFAL